MENTKRKELERRRKALKARLALRRDLDKVLRYARWAVFSPITGRA